MTLLLLDPRGGREVGGRGGGGWNGRYSGCVVRIMARVNLMQL